MDINHIGAWSSLSNVALKFIKYVTDFFKGIRAKKNNIVIHFENTMFPDAVNFWSFGSRGDIQCLHISGNFSVTNNTEKEILLTGCLIKKFKYRGEIQTYNATKKQYDRQYPIPPNSTTKIAINFWIEPPLTFKQGDHLVSKIIIFDNFGARYGVRKVKFRYVGDN